MLFRSARLEFPRETGLILRCAVKVGNPFETKQWLQCGRHESTPGLGRSPGGGHGNPLQYSCLENTMDRKAWRATVHRVTKSQTRLQRLSTRACILAIEPLPVPIAVHSLVPMGKMCERDLPLHLRPQPFSSPSPHAIRSAFLSVREGPPRRQWSQILATPLQPTQRR